MLRSKTGSSTYIDTDTGSSFRHFFGTVRSFRMNIPLDTAVFGKSIGSFNIFHYIQPCSHSVLTLCTDCNFPDRFRLLFAGYKIDSKLLSGGIYSYCPLIPFRNDFQIFFYLQDGRLL